MLNNRKTMRFAVRLIAAAVACLVFLMAMYNYNYITLTGSDRAAKSPEADVVFNKKLFAVDQTNPGSADTGQCKEQRHFAFLKVPKAGSSTVQNIFYRFGTLRWLTFVLPAYNNYISRSRVIDDQAILHPPSGKNNYDIMCNHAPYSHSEFSRLLPNDTKFIGIIREPMPQFESYLYFYHYMDIEAVDKLSEFINNPERYINTKNIKPNPQTSYYGLPDSDVTNVPAIRNFIDRIRKDFDFIIVLERLDESLLVMKRKYCWKITDILYIRKNTNFLNPRRAPSHPKRNRHKGIALAEYNFYTYFQVELIKEVVKGGSDFQQELDFYRTTLRSVNTFCMDERRRWVDTFYIAESKWNPATNISAAVCYLMMMSELKLQDLVGQRQYGKEAWARLHVSDAPKMWKKWRAGAYEKNMNLTLPNGRRVQRRYFDIRDQAKFENGMIQK